MSFFPEITELYFGEDLPSFSLDILDNIARYYLGAGVHARESLTGSILSGGAHHFLAPPAFPAILHVLDYSPGNTLSTAILFMFLSGVLVLIWLSWLHKAGLNAIWLIAFALMPSPIWFTLNISSDLVFATFFAGFFVTYFSSGSSPRSRAIWIICLTGMLLTRPYGLAILLFVTVDQILVLRQTILAGKLTLTAILALIIFGIASFFLLPNFAITLGDGGGTAYFGNTQSVYLNGIFDSLPELPDRVGSGLTLLGAKLLYFAGLRPSYGDLPIHLLFLRGAPGLIILPGLLFIIVKSDMRMRILILLMTVPALMAVSQDRYNLPIQPLLFLSGVTLFSKFGLRIFGGSMSVSRDHLDKR